MPTEFDWTEHIAGLRVAEHIAATAGNWDAAFSCAFARMTFLPAMNAMSERKSVERLEAEIIELRQMLASNERSAGSWRDAIGCAPATDDSISIEDAVRRGRAE